jgi:uncharacterized protein
VRVFLDTNVLFSAFATRGLCADVLRLVLAEHDLVVSAIVLAELGRVVSEKLAVRPEDLDELLRFLGRFRGQGQPEKPVSAAISDTDDLWVLASALAVSAEVFVTGDSEVLALGNLAGMRIVNPRGLWELLRSS